VVVIFRAQKEILWHLTCTECKFYFTYPTMEEKYQIDRGTWTCPKCKKEGRAFEEKRS